MTPGNTAGGEKGSEAVPPPHFLPIIDKMASYVAKNGENFEAMVKSKGMAMEYPLYEK